VIDVNENSASVADSRPSIIASAASGSTTAGGRPRTKRDRAPNEPSTGRLPSQPPSAAGKVDSTTNTDGATGPAAGAPGPEVNQLTAAVSFTGEFLNEGVAPAPRVCNDVFTCDDSIAMSLCCPVAQLSTLTYVDVTVRGNENGPSVTTRALADTGAQISVIKSELLDGFETEIRGKIKLQPFLAMQLRPTGLNCRFCHSLKSPMMHILSLIVL